MARFSILSASALVFIMGIASKPAMAGPAIGFQIGAPNDSNECWLYSNPTGYVGSTAPSTLANCPPSVLTPAPQAESGTPPPQGSGAAPSQPVNTGYPTYPPPSNATGNFPSAGPSDQQRPSPAY